MNIKGTIATFVADNLGSHAIGGFKRRREFLTTLSSLHDYKSRTEGKGKSCVYIIIIHVYNYYTCQ